MPKCLSNVGWKTILSPLNCLCVCQNQQTMPSGAVYTVRLPGLWVPALSILRCFNDCSFVLISGNVSPPFGSFSKYFSHSSSLTFPPTLWNQLVNIYKASCLEFDGDRNEPVYPCEEGSHGDCVASSDVWTWPFPSVLRSLFPVNSIFLSFHNTCSTHNFAKLQT